jgi:hypothetical protein
MADDVTQAAIAAIGHQQADDWILRPEQHAASLPPEAGVLARVLDADSASRLITEFRTADAQAIRAQRLYKFWGSAAIIFSAAATILGALYLLPTHAIYERLGGDAARGPAGIAGIRFETLQTFSAYAVFSLILLSVIAANLVLRLKPFDKWNKARARAEIARIDFFNLVLSADEPTHPGELPLLPLQLEYFRRYQLEVQLAFYRGRGRKHERADRARATRRAIYTTLVSAAAAPASYGVMQLSGVTGLDTGALNNAFLFFGLVAANLVMAQGALSLMSQDRRNASRYRVVAENLAYLETAHLGAARAAAAARDHEGVFAFADAVNDQISAEHREWISLQEREQQPGFEALASAALPRTPHVR